MGWFGKKRKINMSEKLGAEAGELTSSQIKMPFMFTEYLNGEVFTPPSGFWGDLYIRGYCMSYVTTMADVGSAGRGRMWTEPEKQTFLMSALTALVGTSGISNFMHGAREISQNSNYQLGKLHANLHIKLMFTLQKMDLSEPVFEEAVALNEGSEMWDIASAFQKVTITQHIEKTYLS